MARATASCGAQGQQSHGAHLLRWATSTAAGGWCCFGDSHILMWLPALDIIAQQHGYELIPIPKLGCTPYDVVAWKFYAHMP